MSTKVIELGTAEQDNPEMTTRLNGKVSIVTGGASGIGRATVLALAKAGSKVLVADLDENGGEETVHLAKQVGEEVDFASCDVSVAQDVERLVDRCVGLFGRIDCAVNNAGVLGEMASTEECTEANWDRVLAVNLKGVWLCMKYEINQMAKQNKGSIVNMASNAGLVGAAGLPAYTASKGGVIQLTRTAALENAKTGIRVNAVCPGLILTPMVQRQIELYPDAVERFAALEPMGRLGKPEEIAEAVLWLCSDAASFVTGHPMAVDGGILAQ